jgi:hypothetical protein
MPPAAVQVDAMKKSPRIWNRRGFTIAPNGFFTVLKSTGSFAAWRLPGGFRYLAGQLRKTAAPRAQNIQAAALRHQTPGNSDSQETATAILSQSVIPSTRHDRPLRLVFIVLAATAITAISLWYLWWMSHAPCYWYCA